MQNARSSIQDIMKELESFIQKTGYMSIVARAQQMKLPYSLLKPVNIYLDPCNEFLD
jgi:tRNA1(Val) A37 N6-methylase TrmN6